MSYTFPYADDAEDRIRYSSRHVIEATAYPVSGAPIPLDVESGQVTYDESQTPRIQAQLVCKLPGDQSILDQLDPRKTFRVQIRAGYVWDSVTSDVQNLCLLVARKREVKLPDNRMTLDLSSDESLALDYKRAAWDTQPPQSNLKDFVQYHADIARRGSSAATVVTEFTDPAFGASAVAGVTQAPGQDSMRLIADVMNRAGAQVYCDDTGRWIIGKPYALSNTTALKLNTGGGGVISEATAYLDREVFHNFVCLGYKWRDANNVDQVVWGHALIANGPLAWNVIGYNSYFEERNYPATQAQANAAATSSLRALAKRGVGYQMDAVSAYWLRPGLTVTADLPDYTQDRVLVSAVQFNFPSGQMHLRLRRPEDLTISNTQ